LFAFIVTAANTVSTVAADGVDFVDENDARRRFLALLEHVADAAGPDTDEHLDKIGAADGEERNVRFAGYGASDASNVAKGDLVLVPRKHPGFGFAEIERAFARHPDLLAEQEIEHEQEQSDRKKTEHSLRDQVRLGANSWLNPSGGELILQVGIVIEENRGAELGCLLHPCCLLFVITNQRLGRLSFLDDKS
jgi:hypothetical protein